MDQVQGVRIFGSLLHAAPYSTVRSTEPGGVTAPQG